MKQALVQPTSEVETTIDVEIHEDGGPACFSLKFRARDFESLYKRKHAGFIIPNIILSSDISVIAYWVEREGKKYAQMARAFTFLNEKEEMITVLLPVGLTEKKDCDLGITIGEAEKTDG